MGRVRSRKRRVRDDDFLVRYRRISSDVVGLSSNRLSIGGSIQGVSPEILSFKISWQAQCLVRLDGDFTASTHWKWGCICDADHWWLAFCKAGAVFGEVAGCLCLLRALEMRLHMWRRSLMTCNLRGRRSIWRGCRVPLLAPRVGNEVAYVTQIIDDLHFAWQAQHLVRLQGAFACSAHWKWGCICDADHWWFAFCVAGAVFGEVAGCLCLLRAVEMRLHMWRRSLMTCILRGRRSIWWGCRLPLLAPRIGNEVAYVSHITGDIHFPMAGVAFGEVGGWLHLLSALEMTFST